MGGSLRLVINWVFVQGGFLEEGTELAVVDGKGQSWTSGELGFPECRDGEELDRLAEASLPSGRM